MSRPMRQFSDVITFVRSVFLVIMVIFIAGLILLVAGAYIGSCIMKPPIPPDIKIAPWVVQTSTRVYYAESCTVVKGVPVIKDYWILTGNNKYIQVKGELEFDEAFGKVNIARRKE